MKIPEIHFTPKNHKNIGIEIIDLSDIYKRFNSKSLSFLVKPHRINFHNLIYITKGNGSHFVDFNTYSLQAGSVIFIKKNQIHAFGQVNQLQGKLIIFTDEFINTIFSTIKMPLFNHNHLLPSYTPIFSLTDNIKKTCDALLIEIDKEYQLTEPNLRFLHLIFSALLTKLTGTNPKVNDGKLSDVRSKIFTQFILLLERHYTSVHDANMYADMMNITYKSLNQLCKLATNQTVKQLIDAHIILEAKRRLSIEDIRVQQLANQLGFDEATNFVKYFKKHTLLTPTNFKKTIFG